MIQQSAFTNTNFMTKKQAIASDQYFEKQASRRLETNAQVSRTTTVTNSVINTYKTESLKNLMFESITSRSALQAVDMCSEDVRECTADQLVSVGGVQFQ